MMEWEAIDRNKVILTDDKKRNIDGLDLYATIGMIYEKKKRSLARGNKEVLPHCLGCVLYEGNYVFRRY